MVVVDCGFLDVWVRQTNRTYASTFAHGLLRGSRRKPRTVQYRTTHTRAKVVHHTVQVVYSVPNTPQRATLRTFIDDRWCAGCSASRQPTQPAVDDASVGQRPRNPGGGGQLQDPSYIRRALSSSTRHPAGGHGSVSLDSRSTALQRIVKFVRPNVHIVPVLAEESPWHVKLRAAAVRNLNLWRCCVHLCTGWY